jgi:methylated-DNA-[protein]-cysteine S-methyltransferase
VQTGTVTKTETTTDTQISYSVLDSPLGDLLLAADDRGLTSLYLSTGRHDASPRPGWHRCDEAFTDAATQLDEYFAGRRQAFDLPLNPSGTGFQLQVWLALRQIPYGETASYGSTAVAIGHPNGSRAVGLANGRNPISIIVPCHRVIGADGSLTGYGGGLEAKRWLLAHEAKHAGLTLL